MTLVPIPKPFDFGPGNCLLIYHKTRKYLEFEPSQDGMARALALQALVVYYLNAQRKLEARLGLDFNGFLKYNFPVIWQFHPFLEESNQTRLVWGLVCLKLKQNNPKIL